MNSKHCAGTSRAKSLVGTSDGSLSRFSPATITVARIMKFNGFVELPPIFTACNGRQLWTTSKGCQDVRCPLCAAAACASLRPTQQMRAAPSSVQTLPRASRVGSRALSQRAPGVCGRARLTFVSSCLCLQVSHLCALLDAHPLWVSASAALARTISAHSRTHRARDQRTLLTLCSFAPVDRT